MTGRLHPGLRALLRGEAPWRRGWIGKGLFFGFVALGLGLPLWAMWWTAETRASSGLGFSFHPLSRMIEFRLQNATLKLLPWLVLMPFVLLRSRWLEPSAREHLQITLLRPSTAAWGIALWPLLLGLLPVMAFMISSWVITSGVMIEWEAVERMGVPLPPGSPTSPGKWEYLRYFTAHSLVPLALWTFLSGLTLFFWSRLARLPGVLLGVILVLAYGQMVALELLSYWYYQRLGSPMLPNLLSPDLLTSVGYLALAFVWWGLAGRGMARRLWHGSTWTVARS